MAYIQVPIGFACLEAILLHCLCEQKYGQIFEISPVWFWECERMRSKDLTLQNFSVKLMNVISFKFMVFDNCIAKWRLGV